MTPIVERIYPDLKDLYGKAPVSEKKEGEFHFEKPPETIQQQTEPTSESTSSWLKPKKYFKKVVGTSTNMLKKLPTQLPVHSLTEIPKIPKKVYEKVFPSQKLPEDISKSISLSDSIEKKASEYQMFFEDNGFIQMNILEDFFRWSDATFASLEINLDEERRLQIFKRLLQTAFGQPIEVAVSMDQLLQEIKEKEIDSEKKEFLLSKWHNLAWVFNQTSQQPLPQSLLESPEEVIPLLFAPPMDSAEINRPMDLLYQKIAFAQEMAHKGSEKIESNSPVKYSFSTSPDWFNEIPIQIKFNIFDNLIHGIEGIAEKKVKTYFFQKLDRTRNSLEMDNRLLQNERDRWHQELSKKKDQIREGAYQILKGYTLEDKDNAHLKQEIRQFVDSAKGNEIFDSGDFYKDIYEQALHDGVFNRKSTYVEDDQSWGEQHVSHKVDRFLSAYERYKIKHLN